MLPTHALPAPTAPFPLTSGGFPPVANPLATIPQDCREAGLTVRQSVQLGEAGLMGKWSPVEPEIQLRLRDWNVDVPEAQPTLPVLKNCW